MNLRGWKIIDAMGMETKVTLQNEIYGGDLPQFIWQTNLLSLYMQYFF